jgi:hypothetical protein
MAVPEIQIKPPFLKIDTRRMKRIPPRAALTYVGMVRRQHVTKVLQHLFLHRKRIREPSKVRVCLSKVVHGQACTSIQLKKC